MHFITHAIVLRRTLLRERDCLYHVFSREYGRIAVWSRIGRDTPLLDIGTIAECTLASRTEWRTRSMEHRTIRYIRIECLDYASLMNILELLVILSRSLPEGIEYPEVFTEYQLSLDYFERPHGENTKNVAIFLLSLARRLGILAHGVPSTGIHTSVGRIIRALGDYRLDSLYRVTGITTEAIHDLRLVALRSFDRYLTH